MRRHASNFVSLFSIDEGVNGFQSRHISSLNGRQFIEFVKAYSHLVLLISINYSKAVKIILVGDMQRKEWESTVRGAVIVEHPLVPGAQHSAWPEEEGRTAPCTVTVTCRGKWPLCLPSLCLAVTGPLATSLGRHPKLELCTPKFPSPLDWINSQPVVSCQAEQGSCSRCERPSGSLPSWSRSKLKAPPDSP